MNGWLSKRKEKKREYEGKTRAERMATGDVVKIGLSQVDASGGARIKESIEMRL